MRKLKHRFIFAAMVSMFAVLVIMIGGMNIWNYRNLIDRTDQTTHMIADNNGVFPDNNNANDPQDAGRDLKAGNADPGAPQMGAGQGSGAETGENAGRDPGAGSGKAPDGEPDKDPGAGKDPKMQVEAPFQTRYFSVWYNEDGEVSEVSLDHIAAVNEDQAKEYAALVRDNVPDTGFQGIYRYRTVTQESGVLCVFVDCEKDITTMKETLATSLIMSGVGFVAVFALVCLLSTILFKPVEEGYRRQKQFITDAGHELKTPLTIIEANTDVLEMENGESKWLDSTKNQVNRMSGLVQQLVMLARMDEAGQTTEKHLFSLSGAVNETVELFYPVAESRKRTLAAQIESGIDINGDEKSIRQMLELLFDNALKYSLSDSEIRIDLKKKGRKTVFVIENRCEPMEAGNKDQFFERFYRADSSRNSATGGSGIGLAVVRSVADAHQASIHAESPDGTSLRIRIEFNR